MSTETIAAFEAALVRQDVGCTRVPAAEAVDAIEAAIVDPAVGIPLGIDGVSLDAAGVATSPTIGDLEDAATGVTPVGKGIADYGTLVLPSDPQGTEPVSLFPPRHVGVLRSSDVVDGVRDALGWLSNEFAEGRDSAVLATGPSATADMGDLVYGAHGPTTVHVVIVSDR